MLLRNEDISSVLEDIHGFLVSASVPDRDVLKAALVTEEVLLSFQEEFGEDHIVNVKTETRLGTPQIVIRTKGHGFDPINTASADGYSADSVLSRLLDIKGVSSGYSYRMGVNTVCISVNTVRQTKKHFGGPMLYALAAGIILGFLSKLLPTSVFDAVLSVVTPVQSKLMGLLTAVTIPMIFFSLLSSICALNNINELNKNGKKVILRQFLISGIIILASVLTCAVFFSGGSASATGFDKDELLSLILSIFPTNIFTPFTEGNTLQLVVIALFTGMCILVLENRGANIKEAVADLNQLFITMMKYISRIIPVMIFFTLFKTVASGSFDRLAPAWKLVAAAYVSWLVIILLMMGYVCTKWKLSPIRLLRCYAPAIIVSFSALSTTAGGPTLYEIAEDELKIDKKVFEFWYPLSTAVLSTSTGSALICVAFFAAYYNGAAITPSWLIICVLVAFQLSITSPRMAGGILASYAIMFSQLGISGDVAGLIIAANFLWENVRTGLGMLVKCLDITDLAFREHAISEESIEKHFRKTSAAVR